MPCPRDPRIRWAGSSRSRTPAVFHLAAAPLALPELVSGELAAPRPWPPSQAPAPDGGIDSPVPPRGITHCPRAACPARPDPAGFSVGAGPGPDACAAWSVLAATRPDVGAPEPALLRTLGRARPACCGEVRDYLPGQGRCSGRAPGPPGRSRSEPPTSDRRCTGLGGCCNRDHPDRAGRATGRRSPRGRQARTPLWPGLV